MPANTSSVTSAMLQGRVPGTDAPRRNDGGACRGEHQLRGGRRGWIEYAQSMEQAGASALELNIFLLPTDRHADAVQLEQGYARSCARWPVR